MSIGLLSNRLLLVGIELPLALALVYLPGLNRVFHQAPIPWWWMALVVWAPIVVFPEEARKGRRQTQGELSRSPGWDLCGPGRATGKPQRA